MAMMKVVTKKPFKGSSIMLYGTITYNGTFLVRQIDGTLNGQKYLDLLQEDIVPELIRNFNFNFIYQQDGARPHTCSKVNYFFDSCHIYLLEWPSRCPGISLIENIWKIMKDLVYDSI